MGCDCCFLIVGIFNLNLLISTVSVQATEHWAFHKRVITILQAMYGVTVLLAYGVQLLIIDAKA